MRPNKMRVATKQKKGGDKKKKVATKKNKVATKKKMALMFVGRSLFCLVALSDLRGVWRKDLGDYGGRI